MLRLTAMLRLPLFLMLMTLVAPAQQQRPSPSPLAEKFRISGTVVHALTGQPLSSVEVAIGPAQGSDSAQSVITTEDGRFLFENLSAGKYWLAAEGKGFSPQRFDQHQEFSTAIAVGPDVQSQGIVFRLHPDATLTGNILDEQNEPVRNAQVSLFRASVQNGAGSTQLAGQIMTDDRGVYRFSHLAPGTYYVAVAAQPWYADNQFHQLRLDPGSDSTEQGVSAQAETPRSELDVTYPVTYYSGATDPNGATPISLKSGDRAVADIALSPVPALRLRITGIDASKGIAPELMQRSMGGQLTPPVSVQMGQSGKDGIEIRGIPPGQFVLRLHTSGKNPSVREKQIDISQDTETNATDTSTAPSISGIVQLDNGEPLGRRTFVGFLNRASGQSFGVQTSAKGEFNRSGQMVYPGTYEVVVFDLPNAEVKEVSATGAKVTGHQVEISAGAPARVTITVSQGVARVDGVALRGEKPLAGAMVVLVPQDIEHNSSLVRRDQSDSDGTFSLYNVLPGKYTVIALADGWDLQWLSSGVLRPYLKNGETLDVAPRGKYNIKVNVQ